MSALFSLLQLEQFHGRAIQRNGTLAQLFREEKLHHGSVGRGIVTVECSRLVPKDFNPVFGDEEIT